jgi:hypothetical protein
MKRVLLVFCAIASAVSSYTQVWKNTDFKVDRHLRSFTDEDEEEENPEKYKGFGFSLNIGSYFSSKNTANFYNGSCVYNGDMQPNGVRCFSIAERLDPQYFPRDNQNILTYYNAAAIQVPYDAYPLNMRYNPAIYVGLQLKYSFNRSSAIVYNINAMRVKAVDRYTLQFIGTSQQVNAQNDVRLFQIYGQEQRFAMNLGYRYGMEMGDISNFYFQFGGSMNGVKVEKNQIQLAGNWYDLFMNGYNTNIQTRYIPRTNVGFGFYVAPGFQFFIKDNYGFDISFVMSNERMTLIGWHQRGWNKMLQLSFSLQ